MIDCTQMGIYCCRCYYYLLAADNSILKVKQASEHSDKHPLWRPIYRTAARAGQRYRVFRQNMATKDLQRPRMFRYRSTAWAKSVVLVVVVVVVLAVFLAEVRPNLAGNRKLYRLDLPNNRWRNAERRTGHTRTQISRLVSLNTFSHLGKKIKIQISRGERRWRRIRRRRRVSRLATSCNSWPRREKDNHF